ncbi:MAG: filamentous hemagglutinin N-terminal domain-containing protein, partial [Pseudomonadota bacterium]
MQCPKPNVVKIGKTFTNLLTTTALVSMELTRALGPAYGQVIADPGAPIANRPSIGVSAAGNVPSINITTPSSGVSLNRYQQFNVDPSGVILNNTASDSVSSLGSVSGNSNLSVSGPAQTIVNVVPEAQGTHSRLNGPVAVSGTQADVIIVNPTGIECQGCRFENAGTTTLSTGTATVTGSEVNLDVSQGTLLIGRDGVSADGDLSLAARHVYIDGAVTADGELLVSGGAHGLNAHTKEVTPRPASGAPTSAYAIDASEFGAMSGSAIRLIGNEVGLGVRALGDIQSASSIVINSMGGVQTGSVDAETVNISADGAVRLFDNVTAAGEVRISGQDVIVNPGAEINTTGDVAVTASGGVEVHGEIRGLNTVIEAGDWFLNDGFVFGAESVDITAETTLENVRLVEATFEVDYQSWIDDYYDAYLELAASDGLEGY